MSNSSRRPTWDTRTLVTLSMLTAVAYVVMYISKLLPSVMGILDFDFKDVVICIGGFTFGPTAAAVISILVAFIEFITVSATGVIGLIMNILATTSFCCTACFIYKKRHTMTGAVVGLSVGVVVLVCVMLLWNYLIMPLYSPGITRADILALMPTVLLPFNLAKGGMNMAATLLLYKPVVTALRRAGLVPPSSGSQSRKTSTGFILFSLALLATFVMIALVLLDIL